MLRTAVQRTAAATAGAALVVVVAGSGTARAEDLDGEPRFKSVGVQGNPLDFIIGRYSLDLEYLPVAHQALHATAYFEYALPGVDDQLSGFGAEVGYRFYTGAHGPHGFFAGASLLVSELEYIHGNPNNVPLDPANDTQYVELGTALDVGYQVIVLGNFCAGAGAGLQYTFDTISPTFESSGQSWHDLVYGAGLRPRALLQVGAAF